MKVDIVTDEALRGLRLDHALSLLFPTCSRSTAAELVKTGRILVEDQKKKPGFRLIPGQKITGEIPETGSPSELTPEPISLEFIYEDHDILVVNKPAGLVVHPAPGNQTGTLVNALLHHDPSLSRIGEEERRAGIVHRLDKDTSGVMVVARHQDALIFLQKEFKARRVQKQYLALVQGSLKEDQGRICLPIGRHPVKRKQMSTVSSNARPAETLWQVKERFSRHTLVEIELKTGRTHQIRVHFKALGYPLAGDPVYGFKHKSGLAPARQMLHAFKLGFIHPESGDPVQFTAPIPEDFEAVLDRLRKQPHFC